MAGIYGIVLAVNLLAWLWAVMLCRGDAVLLGTALLAYGFGLRHAVDADHIAAIDNVTRKLMQRGQRPLATGLFFALGHSSVVVLVSLAVVLASAAMASYFPVLTALGGVLGTGVSALFLLTAALANLAILVDLWRGAARPISSGGLLARIGRPAFALIGRSWHMAPLGFLFGLGFDTASEIGLLDIAAGQSSHGMAAGRIMVFPALFTAGMMLIDTTDGVMMQGVYGWALADPARHRAYNLAVTALSVVTALAIAAIEAGGLISDHLVLPDPARDLLATVNDGLGLLGCVIIAVFAALWLGAIALSRRRLASGSGEAASPPL